MPYAANQGTRLYWEEQGAGAPLLLLMGLGYSLEMWEDTRDVLAAGYRAILPDNRGVGRSDVPAPPYSIAEMAQDAVAVLDAAGVGRAHVFGVSMGGLIAQELALRHPGRVHSLVLGCTFCGGPRAVRAEARVLGQLGMLPVMSVEDGFRTMAPFIYHPATPPERLERALELRQQHYPTARGFMGQMLAITAYESCGRLGGIAAPTLVIHGDSDLLVPTSNAGILAELIPGAELVIVPNASHIFPADQPDFSHAAVLSFLSRHPLKKGTDAFFA